MNNFKKSLIFIIFTILCPAKTVFSMPVRDLVVGGGIVLSSPLLIYKLLRHNGLKNELEQDREALLSAKTSEEKRFLKKEITQKEKALLARGKTISRIAAIAGSAATFILSDLLWRRGPVPTKILGCCAGGFLFYKIKMHSMFGKKLKELKSVLEETKSSREAAFLKIEIKKLERAIFSRKATIIIATIGSMLTLSIIHKAARRGLFQSAWDNLMASFQQPVPPPAEPPFWFVPPREVFSGVSTTPAIFKDLDKPNAIAPNDLAQDTSKNSCPICLDNFNEAYISTRIVHNVPCGHSVCLGCAKRSWIENNSRYQPQECCKCRDPITDVIRTFD